MKSDLELFLSYVPRPNDLTSNTYSNCSKLTEMFELLKNSVQGSVLELIDLDGCKVNLEEAMQLISLRKRYLVIKREAKDKLDFSPDGFELDGHKFQTIDDLEKAFKMKAFL